MKKAKLVNELKKLEFLVLNVDDHEIIDLWNKTHPGEDVKNIEEASSCRKVIILSKLIELRVRLQMNLED